MKVQFLLLSDGVSHKLLGLNVVDGLRQLGIDVEYYFPSRSAGKLMSNPDYVFVLKPGDRHIDLLKSFSKSKICLIMNDMGSSSEVTAHACFFVSPSVIWQAERSPCYLVREEFGHYTSKIHTPESFKLVFAGYKENMVNYLSPVIDIIYEKYTDITIVSNFGENDCLPPSFYKCNMKNFYPSAWDNIFAEDYERDLINQFVGYDVGIKVQPPAWAPRTSNGVKLFMYSGLPVVASYTANNADLWFNKSGETVCLVQSPDQWLEYISYLQDYKVRQSISDANFEIVKRNAGVVKSAESFLGAIEQYERSH